MTRKAVVLALVAVAVGLAGACAETRRTNGEDCLKSQDCLSGICSQLVCIAAPPTTDQKPTNGDASTADAAAEAAPEAAAPEAAAETGGGETGSDAAPDAAAD
jgi:hypothetical protein